MLVLFQRYQTRIGGARNLSLSNLQGMVQFHDYFVVRDWTVTLIHLISIWMACSARVTHVGIVSEVSDKDWRTKELSSANLQGMVLSHDYFVAHDWTVTLIPLISIWMACNSRVTHVGVVSDVSDKDWRSKEFITLQSTRNSTISRLFRCSCLNSDSDTSDFDMDGL